jgi:hypothetical protein
MLYLHCPTKSYHESYIIIDLQIYRYICLLPCLMLTYRSMSEIDLQVYIMFVTLSDIDLQVYIMFVTLSNVDLQVYICLLPCLILTYRSLRTWRSPEEKVVHSVVKSYFVSPGCSSESSKNIYSIYETWFWKPRCCRHFP